MRFDRHIDLRRASVVVFPDERDFDVRCCYMRPTGAIEVVKMRPLTVELLSNLVYSRSGGDPVFLIDDLLSVAELDVVDDQFELPESLDALPPLLGALEQLEDHRQGGLA